MSSSIYTQDVEGCMAQRVGDGGLDEPAFARSAERAARALEPLRRARAARALPYLTLPAERDDLNAFAVLAARFRGTFDDVVILGTGGSSLGGRAVAALADVGFGSPVGSPKVHFLDNVDPDTFDSLFAALDLAKTGVLAISKSGGTAETICQLAIVLNRLRERVGEAKLSAHVAVMTEPADNPLSSIAARFNLELIPHDPNLGGRFSVLSTGMLPAMLLGVDATALRAGAAEVLDAALDPDAAIPPAPAAGAAVQIALAEERGVTQSILMPYCDRLAWFTRWYRQLWAESLGKQGRGTTPIDAAGTVDQHSQLQLYLDGPRDKVFTVLRVAAASGGGDRVDPVLTDHPGLGYLHNRRMGELFDAEANATASALMEHGRPVRMLHVPVLDARTLGGLFMHFMLETAIAADMLGVDAYDQPAVESGKRLTKQYLTGMTS